MAGELALKSGAHAPEPRRSPAGSIRPLREDCASDLSRPTPTEHSGDQPRPTRWFLALSHLRYTTFPHAPT